MVKADMERDYYADLELPATCTEAEIKKQFKKLALKYHPDRNPGREAEVNSKFQTIQSAHEVLADLTERTRYDAGRRLGVRARGSGFASGPTTSSTGMKGNPWANAGKEWAPPPKPPGFQSRKPPPSAGASRYADNFGAGKPTPPRRPAKDSATAAEERKNNFTAWESMRNNKNTTKNPEVPKTAYSGFESQPGRRVPPRPGSFANFNPDENDLGRTPSQRKNGYAPGNSGGDEPPAASTSSYFTNNRRPVPPIPGRDPGAARDPPASAPPPPPPNSTRPPRPINNSLFDESRISTPYTSHSGEKTNPFERFDPMRSTNNMRDGGRAPGEGNSPTSWESRSVSPARKRQAHVSPDSFGLDPNLNGSATKRANRSSQPGISKAEAKYTPAPAFPTEASESSSDDITSKPRAPHSRPMATPRKARTQKTSSNAAPQQGAKIFSENLSDTGKDSGPSQYEPLVTSLRNSTSLPMFAGPSDFLPSTSFFAPTISAPYVSHSAMSTKATPRRNGVVGKGKNRLSAIQISDITEDEYAPKPPSGSQRPDHLYPLETAQFDIIDKIIQDKSRDSRFSGTATASGPSIKRTTAKTGEALHQATKIHNSRAGYKLPSKLSSATPNGHGHQGYHTGAPLIAVSSADIGSPVKKPRLPTSYSSSNSNADLIRSAFLSDLQFGVQGGANINSRRFSSDADGSASSGSHPRGFAGSTEKIDTTFSPEGWRATFESGDYFTAGGKSNEPSRSGSRARSPIKRRPLNKVPPVAAEGDQRPRQDSDVQTPNMSPTPAKFTPEEWDKTFKPQTFSPNVVSSPGSSRTRSQRRQRTGTSARVPPGMTKAGNAAMVDDDSAEEEKALFDKQTASPNAMDVDEPASARNVPLEPSRAEWRAGDASGLNAQAAGPARPPKVEVADDEEDFKTNFEDLKNVEPFTNTPKGLNSFGDLASTLPFPSGASTGTAPITRDFQSQALVLPQPPKAPALPNIIVDATRPSESSWNSYLATFKGYMAEWSMFNQTMIRHFNARQKEFENIKVGWLDAHLSYELDKYVASVKEDATVRTWWTVAAEKHENAMKDFQWIKKVYIEGLDKVIATDE